MSSPLPRSAPSRKVHLLRWMLVVVAALILACGLSIGFTRNSYDDKESRESAGEISQYLSLVQRRDRPGADAMLCGGDDSGPADLPAGYLEDGHAPVVESFAIVNTWDWSSVLDGHGTGYLVRMLFADGSTADVELVVEVISDDLVVTVIGGPVGAVVGGPGGRGRLVRGDGARVPGVVMKADVWGG